jgi:hypothetical protein
MKVIHHGSEKGELPDEWLAETDMLSFSPKSEAYRVDARGHEGKVFSVPIVEVSPVIRSPGVPIFKDDPETGRPARERVVSILRGFRADAEIAPVQVRCMEPGSEHKYELKAGAHRFYCSLAVGFAAVPAVEGFDWSTLDK